MNAETAILHSDLNCFYASVETMLDPSLRGKAVAVCGCTEDRHGIVLAKSELAKKAGVKTGMVNWEAKQCCRDLIIVPPQYDQYLKYSKLTQAIYQRYTDMVEPFGIDRHPLTLSGGQRQRLAICQAIMGKKKFLIFHEPTSGLDFRHMCQVTEWLKQLAQHGYILFVVTHDYEFLNRACNCYVRIDKIN